MAFHFKSSVNESLTQFLLRVKCYNIGTMSSFGKFSLTFSKLALIIDNKDFFIFYVNLSFR